MGAVTHSTFADVRDWVRTDSLIADSESNVMPILPARGFGTLRVWLDSNVVVTLRIYGKPRRLSTTSLVTMRLIATRTVAVGTSMEPLDFNIRSDYVKITAQGATVPTRFEMSAQLVP